MFILDLP